MEKIEVRKIGQRRLSRWLNEMVDSNAVPVMVIGISDDGRVPDIDMWTLENMKTVDIRIIIQRVIEKIFILEIERRSKTR